MKSGRVRRYRTEMKENERERRLKDMKANRL
jgi:hypothetical protein